MDNAAACWLALITTRPTEDPAARARNSRSSPDALRRLRPDTHFFSFISCSSCTRRSRRRASTLESW